MKGFFYKEETPAPKGAKSAPKGAKPARSVKVQPVHELPPVLIVPVAKELKKNRVKQQTMPSKPQLEMDIECYVNYFLVKFRRENGTYTSFEKIDSQGVDLDKPAIKDILDEYEIITFNGLHYDLPMLNYAIHSNCTNKDLKKASDELIKSELAVYKFEDRYGLSPMMCDHVDLAPMTPVMTSLKLCGARLHCDKLQDLPYDEDSVLSKKQMVDVDEYCQNDVDVLARLKSNLTEEIELRRALSKKYGINVMSKSDPQIAEEIIKAEVFSRTGRQIKKAKELHTMKFHYQVPDFISFTNPSLNAVLDLLKHNMFVARPVTSGVKMPEQLDNLEIKIGKSIYRMGIGGLHSSEKSAFHVSNDAYDLWDWDVTSYYPAIMLQCGLYPKSIGESFLDTFKDIVDDRLAAKAAGDKVKADSLKITINGTFGKTGSPYSILYAPDMMIQVTVTGQLSLLMLIDSFDQRGFDVVSGNTDGIIVKCERGREMEMKSIVSQWENATGFNMESARYAGVYSRDINNYIAIGYDGNVKLKGCFAPGKRQKNPEYDVCTIALIAYLKTGAPIEDTIRACRDIRKFVSVRRVNGGAVKDGKYLGKVVRWYYSKNEQGFIAYKTNGNKVPQSDGAQPMMVLPDQFPDDINYEWYINKCKDLLY